MVDSIKFGHELYTMNVTFDMVMVPWYKPKIFWIPINRPESIFVIMRKYTRTIFWKSIT